MKIYSVTDERFKTYGRVVTGIDFSELCKAMEETPCPEDVIYVPGDPKLEALPVMKELTDKTYGELQVQIGYCNGHNCMLNAFEYHRSSEINVAATDAVLILGSEQDITDDFHYDTSLMEAFKIPKGTAVEIYGTTLHYAPCDLNNEGFKVTVVLPKGTNEPLDEAHKDGEDKLITAKNKWLIAHEEAGIEGAVCGLKGENIDIAK